MGSRSNRFVFKSMPEAQTAFPLGLFPIRIRLRPPLLGPGFGSKILIGVCVPPKGPYPAGS